MALTNQLKIIGRDDLQSSESEKSPSPDLETQDRLREALQRQFGLIEYGVHEDSDAVEQQESDSPRQDEVLEFRMFDSDAAPRTIDLREPFPPISAVTSRPDSYYFAPAPSAERLQELAVSAVSGDDVLERSLSRWAGCSLPWKVIGASKGPPVESTITERMKRRRPSKKARIALRMKVRAKQDAEEHARKATEEKEAYLREKKTAMNRKKQAKRRAKEKAKKTESGDGNTAEAPD